MKILTGVLLLFVVIVPCVSQIADVIMFNGKIFTSDTTQLYVQALAVSGNRILSVGRNSEILKLASPKTHKIDLKGKVVVPGFNNAHEHIGWDIPIGKVFRSNGSSVAGPGRKALLDSIARLVTLAKPNQWIGGDIGVTLLHDVSLRSALDSIAPKHPVYLRVPWGHGSVLNSKGLQTLNISETAPDPLGGWYTRYPGTNQISGAIHEYAQYPIWYAIPLTEEKNLRDGILAFCQAQLQSGITTIQNMSCNAAPEPFTRILREANLPLRIRIVPMPGTSAAGRNLKEWKNISTGNSRLLYLSGVKYLIDGTSLEQGAFMKKAYPGTGDWYGRLDMPIDTVKQILREALGTNVQLMIHVTGDSSMALVLSAMKTMAESKVWQEKRVRIEHNATPHMTDLERDDVKSLGLLMMHTPKYCTSSPLRSLLENGIKVGISPDGTTNPFFDIMMITSRQTNPAENITREQAVIAFTLTNAYAEFAEHEKGMLKKGMLADLAILSQDIFSVPTERLPVTTCLLTMVDGKIVYNTLR